MQRDLGQMSLADGLVNQRRGRNDWLDEVGKLIEWQPLLALLKPIYAADEGKPSYPHLTMLKLVLLQNWYSLSDPGLEEAVDDRLSFRRFAGLPLDKAAPDHTTIWRFREELVKRGLGEAVFEEVNRQLEAKGLMVKRGTLIDASIVAAAVKPPSPDEGTVTERDPDAGFTGKGGKSHFGYKAHVGVDEGTDLIRKAEYTSADVHDSVPADALISGDEGAAYGDKAYDSQERRERLREAGIADRLMYRARRNRPLKPWQVAFNKAVSPVRSGVERVFARMKTIYGYRRARYRGLARNRNHFLLLAAAMNMRRALALAS